MGTSLQRVNLMTDTDENLLTAAKLREQVSGELEGDERLLDHAGLLDERNLDTLTFLEESLEDWNGSDLSHVVGKTWVNRAATAAIRNGDFALASYLVGVTETSWSGSSIEVSITLVEELRNNGAPAFVVGSGNPETGKTNTMFKLISLYDRVVDDLLVLSNSRTWDRCDIPITGMHELMVECLRQRDRRKVIVIDESSTHFDARTHRHEVASQWTPAAKRFAKIGVDVCGQICHTGMDFHPEAKRLCTLAYEKIDKKTVEWFSNWPGSTDYPSDSIFSGAVQDLEPYWGFYDSDEAAPWSWNLETDLFQLDLTWSGLLEKLLEAGPSHR